MVVTAGSCGDDDGRGSGETLELSSFYIWLFCD